MGAIIEATNPRTPAHAVGGARDNGRSWRNVAAAITANEHRSGQPTTAAHAPAPWGGDLLRVSVSPPTVRGTALARTAAGADPLDRAEGVHDLVEVGVGQLG